MPASLLAIAFAVAAIDATKQVGRGTVAEDDRLAGKIAMMAGGSVS